MFIENTLKCSVFLFCIFASIHLLASNNCSSVIEIQESQDIGRELNSQIESLKPPMLADDQNFCIHFKLPGGLQRLSERVNLLASDFVNTINPSVTDRSIDIRFTGDTTNPTVIELECDNNCDYGFTVLKTVNDPSELKLKVHFENMIITGGPTIAVTGGGALGNDPQVTLTQMRIRGYSTEVPIDQRLPLIWAERERHLCDFNPSIDCVQLDVIFPVPILPSAEINSFGITDEPMLLTIENSALFNDINNAQHTATVKVGTRVKLNLRNSILDDLTIKYLPFPLGHCYLDIGNTLVQTASIQKGDDSPLQHLNEFESLTDRCDKANNYGNSIIDSLNNHLTDSESTHPNIDYQLQYSTADQQLNSRLIDKGHISSNIDPHNFDLAGLPRQVYCGASAADVGPFEYQQSQVTSCRTQFKQYNNLAAESRVANFTLNFNKPVTCLQNQWQQTEFVAPMFSSLSSSESPSVSPVINQPVLPPSNDPVIQPWLPILIDSSNPTVEAPVFNEDYTQLTLPYYYQGDKNLESITLSPTDQPLISNNQQDDRQCDNTLVFYQGDLYSALGMSQAILNGLNEDSMVTGENLDDIAFTGRVHLAYVSVIEINVCIEANKCRTVTIDVADLITNSNACEPNQPCDWSMGLVQLFNQAFPGQDFSQTLTFKVAYLDQLGNVVGDVVQPEISVPVYTQPQSVVAIQVSQHVSPASGVQFIGATQGHTAYYKYQVQFRNPDVSEMDKQLSHFNVSLEEGFFNATLMTSTPTCRDNVCDYWVRVTGGFTKYQDQLKFETHGSFIASANASTSSAANRISADTVTVAFEEPYYGKQMGSFLLISSGDIAERIGDAKLKQLAFNRLFYPLHTTLKLVYANNVTMEHNSQYGTGAGVLNLANDECISEANVSKANYFGDIILNKISTTKGRSHEWNGFYGLTGVYGSSKTFRAPPGYHINGFDFRAGEAVHAIKPVFKPLPQACLNNDQRLLSPIGNDVVKTYQRDYKLYTIPTSLFREFVREKTEHYHHCDPPKYDGPPECVYWSKVYKYYNEFDPVNPGGIGQVTTVDGDKKSYKTKKYNRQKVDGHWKARTNDGEANKQSKLSEHRYALGSDYLVGVTQIKDGSLLRGVTFFNSCGVSKSFGRSSGQKIPMQTSLNQMISTTSFDSINNPSFSAYPNVSNSFKGASYGHWCETDQQRTIQNSELASLVGIEPGQYLKAIRFSQKVPNTQSTKSVGLRFDSENGKLKIARNGVPGAVCIATQEEDKAGIFGNDNCAPNQWQSDNNDYILSAPTGYYIEQIYMRAPNINTAQNNINEGVRLLAVKIAPMPYVNTDSDDSPVLSWRKLGSPYFSCDFNYSFLPGRGNDQDNPLQGESCSVNGRRVTLFYSDDGGQSPECTVDHHIDYECRPN